MREDFFIGFLEEDFAFWKIKFPKRLLIPFLLVLAAKVAGSVFIYYGTGVAASGTFWSDPSRVFAWDQNKVFLITGNISKWPFIFVGWDSAWYLSIMNRGYAFSPQAYTFSPGLPLFGNLFNLFLSSPLISIALCGFVFGVIWVPIFQLLAENYVSKRAAIACTLLLAFSPFVFVFTTVSYTEGLVLFFTSAAWLLFQKGKRAGASALGAVAVLSRVTGVLVVLPMLYGALKQKGKGRMRNFILSLVPVLALISWYGYGLFSSGDLLAPVHTTEWAGLYTVPSFLLNNLPQKGLSAFSAISLQNWPASQFWLTPVAIAAAVFIPPFLMYKMKNMDRELLMYSVAGYVGILVFGAIVSFPRFVSVLFPLWLPLTAKLSLGKKQSFLVGMVLIAFLVLSIDMWVSFLNGQFVA